MDTVSPEELHKVLIMGRTAILDHIEAFYAQTAEKNPGATIVRPSISVVGLSPNRHKTPVVSSYGTLNDTNIYRHPIELTSGKPRELWAATLEAQFTPEARLFSRGRDQDNVSLMVRNPETDPVPLTSIDDLPAALGFIDPAITDDLLPLMREAFTRGGEADDDYVALRRAYQDAAEAKIDERGDVYGPVNRSHAQLGFLLARQLLRFRVEGASVTARYIVTLRQAEEIAYNLYLDEVVTVLNHELQSVAPLYTPKTTP